MHHLKLHEYMRSSTKAPQHDAESFRLRLDSPDKWDTYLGKMRDAMAKYSD
jgi:hypothetical protein